MRFVIDCQTKFRGMSQRLKHCIHVTRVSQVGNARGNLSLLRWRQFRHVDLKANAVKCCTNTNADSCKRQGPQCGQMVPKGPLYGRRDVSLAVNDCDSLPRHFATNQERRKLTALLAPFDLRIATREQSVLAFPFVLHL